jgi:hypothetical protein
VVGTVTKIDIVSDSVVDSSVVLVIFLYFLMKLVVVIKSVKVVGWVAVSVMTVRTGWVMMSGSVTVNADGTVTFEVFTLVIFLNRLMVFVLVAVAVSVLVRVEVVGDTEVNLSETVVVTIIVDTLLSVSLVVDTLVLTWCLVEVIVVVMIEVTGVVVVMIRFLV